MINNTSSKQATQKGAIEIERHLHYKHNTCIKQIYNDIHKQAKITRTNYNEIHTYMTCVYDQKNEEKDWRGSSQSISRSRSR
mmetsp:Transcript_4618/g.7916  ORF Transcript_4618/g.7916 Transcript_4618/m.7916 type:complete len:82 (-) Transcript_4618:412-657(-)